MITDIRFRGRDFSHKNNTLDAVSRASAGLAAKGVENQYMVTLDQGTDNLPEVVILDNRDGVSHLAAYGEIEAALERAYQDVPEEQQDTFSSDVFQPLSDKMFTEFMNPERLKTQDEVTSFTDGIKQVLKAHEHFRSLLNEFIGK